MNFDALFESLPPCPEMSREQRNCFRTVLRHMAADGSTPNLKAVHGAGHYSLCLTMGALGALHAHCDINHFTDPEAVAARAAEKVLRDSLISALDRAEGRPPDAPQITMDDVDRNALELFSQIEVFMRDASQCQGGTERVGQLMANALRLFGVGGDILRTMGNGPPPDDSSPIVVAIRAAAAETRRLVTQADDAKRRN